ncbi:MAG: ribbon-helix-helix domain-containing protein [Planctomycetota bacterium]|jgi:predicted DNA-binding protein
MKQAHRLFNLLLPFKTYEELKRLSVEIDKPVAEIVRQAISVLLEKTKNTEGIQLNDKT